MITGLIGKLPKHPERPERMERVRVWTSLLLLWLACAGYARGEGVKVGSFNMDVFGRTKFSKDEVVATLSQVYKSS